MKKILSSILLASFFLSVFAQIDDIYSGDVNHDGKITIADVEQLIRIILKQAEKEKIVIKDGAISFEEESQGEDTLIINHDYVNLGLPSGTKWAKCNLGAEDSLSIGNKYAWGETAPKTEGSWESYQYKGSQFNKYTKYYFPVESHGVVDSLATLRLIDDAASRNWGGDWRMPTQQELAELGNSCYWEVASRNSVPGLVGISIMDASKTIFIPFAGRIENDSIQNRIPDPVHGFEASFYLWASDLKGTVNPYCADFQNGNFHVWDASRRHWGQSVRAVMPSGGNDNGHRGVDLGLSSGLIWATKNIGAESDEDYGDFYAWGEYGVKQTYSWDNYHFAGSVIDGFETFRNYVLDETWGDQPDCLEHLDAADDAATHALGEGWRTPSVAQLEELMNCTTAQTVSNGVELTSKINGEKLYLPFTFIPSSEEAGYNYVFLWTNELNKDYSSHANLIMLRDPYDIIVGWYGLNRREDLFPIRPVYMGH